MMRACWKHSSAAFPCQTSVKHDDTANVLTIAHVLVTGVDLVERVGPGDELIEFELALTVEVEQLGDVGTRVAGGPSPG
jgi:hypothetical protein